MKHPEQSLQINIDSHELQSAATAPMDTAAPQQQHQFALCGLSQALISLTACIAYMTISSGLILLNKELLSNGFHYPMALSGLGMAFSGYAAFVACKVCGFGDPHRVVSASFYMTKIMPVGLCMAATLSLGNLAYLYLTVSFIQMLKAVVPVITMITLFLFGLEKPSTRLILSVAAIACGTALASVGEVNLDLLGVVIVLASIVFEALRLVMTQLLLVDLKFHPIEGLMYLAPSCCAWMFAGTLFFEVASMRANGAAHIIISHPLRFAASAVMAFAVNGLSFIVIQATSSVTLKVLGIVRNVLVVGIGIFVLADKVTPIEGCGYGISMAGFCWYQQQKLQGSHVGAALKERTLLGHAAIIMPEAKPFLTNEREAV